MKMSKILVIFKPFIKLFKLIYRIIDKIIVTPISRLIYKLSEISKDNSGKFERILNRPNVLIYVSLLCAIAVFLLVDSQVISFTEREAEIITDQKVSVLYNQEAYVAEVDDPQLNPAKANKATTIESQYFKRYAKMEQKGEDELNSIIEQRFIFNEDGNYEDANKILGYYENIPKAFKSKYSMSLKKSAELDNKDFIKKATDLHDKITSWNYDKDEEIIMDKDKIPQKVVITHNAKKGLLKSVHGNMELFDNYLKKFYSAAQTRTGNKGGQGIKTIPGSGYDAEIKIKGNGGDIRMYTRPVTHEDNIKYSSTDNINVKYIFDTCGEHL